MKNEIKNWVLGGVVAVLLWFAREGFQSNAKSIKDSIAEVKTEVTGIGSKVNVMSIDMAVLKDRKEAEKEVLAENRRHFTKIKLFQMQQKKENDKIHNDHDKRIVVLETQCKI